MRVQSLFLLVTVALQGSVAQPAHRHAYLHKRTLQDVVEKRSPQDFSDPSLYTKIDWVDKLKGKDWTGVDFSGGSKQSTDSTKSTKESGDNVAQTVSKYKAGTEEEEEPEKKPAKSTVSPSKDESGVEEVSSGGDCSDLSDLHIESNSNSKRATVQQDNYIGNTGAAGYGSNIKPEKNCKPSGPYSLTIINEGTANDFWVWNKVGADGQALSGMTGGAKEFHLKKGQKATFSIERNTQMGFSKAIGRSSDHGGVPNGNIGEANFEDANKEGKGKGSAYDVSMVTYNEIKSPHKITGKVGNPVLVPLTVYAKDMDKSTTDKCVYTKDSQNSPVNPWTTDGGCKTWVNEGSPLHVIAVFD